MGLGAEVVEEDDMVGEAGGSEQEEEGEIGGYEHSNWPGLESAEYSQIPKVANFRPVADKDKVIKMFPLQLVFAN